MYTDPSTVDRIKSRTRADDRGCWVWTGPSHERTGYAEIFVRGKREGVHRAMYRAVHGGIPEGLCICHRCDVRLCVNPEHLFAGTHKENLEDMARKGRSTRGARNGRAKLTLGQVQTIRASDLPQRALARMYGVAQSQVWRIKSGFGWK